MNDLLLKSYEFLTVLLPFLVTFEILTRIYKHKKITQPKGRFFILAVFVIYVFYVFYFTGMGTIFDFQRYGVQLNPDQINLLPFSKDIDVVAYFLNILLFLPFGFLLPFIWPQINKLKYIIISGFSFSLLIEISQLCNNRRTDIDDFILEYPWSINRLFDF